MQVSDIYKIKSIENEKIQFKNYKFVLSNDEGKRVLDFIKETEDYILKSIKSEKNIDSNSKMN